MRLIVALVLLLSTVVQGQTSGEGTTDKADEAPTLTQVQRLQLEKAVLVYQNTQLRLQLAQDDHTRSRLELQDVLKGLPRKEGWQFDLDKFVYAKKAPPAPLGETAPK